jgi:hypothetical protein
MKTLPFVWIVLFRSIHYRLQMFSVTKFPDTRQNATICQ